MTHDELLAGLPPVWPDDPLPATREALGRSGRTIVALDDDPTGTQTVYDVPVLTDLAADSIAQALADRPPLLFLLTNSRSLPGDRTRELHRFLGEVLAFWDVQTVISRSDSTLRGHYPVETDALCEGLGMADSLTLLVPFFEAGGRITVNDTHYVVENGVAVPASETPFARDAVFGYRTSHLPSYVEEKTAGRVKAADVRTLSLEVVRNGPEAVASFLTGCPAGAVCTTNAVAQRDVEVIAAGARLAEEAGCRILARTGASYVQARAGLPNRPALEREELPCEGSAGGLVVVGSHVPKTTAQLAVLLEHTPDWEQVEVAVPRLLDERRDSYLAALAEGVAEAIAAGRNVVLSTSRDLVLGSDDAANLDISARVSSALVEVVQAIPRPRFLIGKGGITSSDLATKALGVRRATVLGAVVAGIPVWQLGEEARFPGLIYVSFPGNTGGDDALWQAVQKLTA